MNMFPLASSIVYSFSSRSSLILPVRIEFLFGRMARLLSGFPYYKLTQYIKYKAALAGIKVIEVSEAWTSQYCKTCNQKGTRKIQGLFQCQTCGEDNADRNAAYNIAKRGLGQASNLVATVDMPRTPIFFKMGEAT